MEAVAAAIGAALTIGGGVWHLSGRLSRIEAIIQRELTPNGGDSLRDRVVRIEATLKAEQINRAAAAETDHN